MRPRSRASPPPSRRRRRSARSASAPAGDRGFLAAALLAAAFAGAYVAAQAEPAWLLSAGIAASVLSGNSAYVGLPIGPDRLLIAAGLFAVVMGDVARRHTRGDGLWGLPRLTFTHWVLVAAAAWALVSAARAGTLTQSAGVFGLLDRFGFVPFAMFFVAPLAFATERQRSILLGTLVALGAYLGLTALFEGVGLRALVFPGYISDPAVGIHFGRARGPFVEAVANGMGLFTCATAAAVGLSRWEGWRARYACWAVIALCDGRPPADAHALDLAVVRRRDRPGVPRGPAPARLADPGRAARRHRRDRRARGAPRAATSASTSAPPSRARSGCARTRAARRSR